MGDLTWVHSTVIWFSVLLGWGSVGTVPLFLLELKILEGLHLTITVPIPLPWDEWNQIRGMVA